MLQHLVVAIDPAGGPSAAGRWAVALAAGASARVTFVDPHPRPAGELRADELLRPAARAVTATRIAYLHRPGVPARSIGRVAGEVDADLIVTGAGAAPHDVTTPTGDADRDPDRVEALVDALLGGSAPVAVVPDDAALPDAAVEWVVAVDGTPAGDDALEWTRTVADRIGGRITVVLAHDGAGVAATRPGEAESRAHLDPAGDRLRHLLVAPHDGGEALRRTAGESPRPAVIVAGQASRHLSPGDAGPATAAGAARFATTAACPVVLVPS
jgi:nucleotide-binding universal stress UspA family protein